MNQEKIGLFIKLKRKEKKITQSDLADRLNVTDRAISKWENGICMPDVGIIPKLCEILNITINDLFSGEIVDIRDNEKRLEDNLVKMIKLKQEADKHLLVLEIIIGVLAVMIFFVLILIAAYGNMENIYRGLLLGCGFLIFLGLMFIALRIEQTAGYYACRKCQNKYVPTYKSVFWAMHMGRTRYMKCPKCHKYSWNKKVIMGDEVDD